jgi:hypothetical protein
MVEGLVDGNLRRPTTGQLLNWFRKSEGKLHYCDSYYMANSIRNIWTVAHSYFCEAGYFVLSLLCFRLTMESMSVTSKDCYVVWTPIPCLS